MTAKLTFAIPFYRGHAYLRQAIDSVLAQSVDDWRVIVVDDCGPEQGTDQLVDSYDDPRIIYSRNEQNLGLAGNWNRCRDLVETDFFTLLHQDDRLLPGYAETMLATMAAEPEASAVFCQAQVIGEDGKEVFSAPDLYKRFIQPHNKRKVRLSGESASVQLVHGNFIMCPTLCFRRSRVKDEPYNAAWSIVLDWEYSLRLLRAGHTLIGIPDECYAYRRHAASESGKSTHENNQQLIEESRFLDIVAQEYDKLGWRDAAKTARRKNVVKLRACYYAMHDVLRLRFRAGYRKWTEVFG